MKQASEEKIWPSSLTPKPDPQPGYVGNLVSYSSGPLQDCWMSVVHGPTSPYLRLRLTKPAFLFSSLGWVSQQ